MRYASHQFLAHTAFVWTIDTGFLWPGHFPPLPSAFWLLIWSAFTCFPKRHLEGLGSSWREKKKTFLLISDPIPSPRPLIPPSFHQIFLSAKNVPFASGKVLTLFPQHVLFQPSNTKFSLGFAFSDALGKKALVDGPEAQCLYVLLVTCLVCFVLSSPRRELLHLPKPLVPMTSGFSHGA